MMHINDVFHKTDKVQTVDHVYDYVKKAPCEFLCFIPGERVFCWGGRFNVNKEMGHMCLSLFSRPNIRDYMEDL